MKRIIHSPTHCKYSDLFVKLMVCIVFSSKQFIFHQFGTFSKTPIIVGIGFSTEKINLVGGGGGLNPPYSDRRTFNRDSSFSQRLKIVSLLFDMWPVYFFVV